MLLCESHIKDDRLDPNYLGTYMDSRIDPITVKKSNTTHLKGADDS